LRPDATDAFAGLGRVLHKLGRMSEFDAALEAVIGSPQIQNGKPKWRRRPESGGPRNQVLLN
jgi:hypothetical protein